MWFRWKSKCEYFDREKIPERQFKWFIYIVRYLQFVTGETVSTLESHRDEVHTVKVKNTKEQYIVISSFKMDIPPLLRGLREGKDRSTPLTVIRTPELWNAHDGVRYVYPRASTSLHDQRIKLQAGSIGSSRFTQRQDFCTVNC